MVILAEVSYRQNECNNALDLAIISVVIYIVGHSYLLFNLYCNNDNAV